MSYSLLQKARPSAYMIRNLAVRKGELPSMQEPIVGRWYCGMEVEAFGDDEFARDGELMRYEGEGCWSSDDTESEDEPNPGNYDWLEEQVGGSAA